MSKTIWKFKLADSIFELRDTIEIQAPRFAKFISVGKQWETIVAWAEVVPEQPLETTKILVRGTGYPFTRQESHFLGTLQGASEYRVFHFYTSK